MPYLGVSILRRGDKSLRHCASNRRLPASEPVSLQGLSANTLEILAG